jgi:hypothetical protein
MATSSISAEEYTVTPCETLSPKKPKGKEPNNKKSKYIQFSTLGFARVRGLAGQRRRNGAHIAAVDLIDAHPDIERITPIVIIEDQCRLIRSMAPLGNQKCLGLAVKMSHFSSTSRAEDDCWYLARSTSLAAMGISSWAST